MNRPVAAVPHPPVTSGGANAHLAEKSRAYDPPAWFDEIDSAQVYAHNIVLSGNIRDIFPVASEDGQSFLELDHTLARLLKGCGIDCLFSYDDVAGLQFVTEESIKLEPFLQEVGIKTGQIVSSLQDLANFQARLMTVQTARVALVIDYASHLKNNGPDDLVEFFVTVDKSSRMRRSSGAGQANGNITLWLVDHPSDLPGWFVIDNDYLRDVHIELPNLEDRFLFGKFLAQDLGWNDEEPQEITDQLVQQFALECDGETLVAMRAIAKVAKAEKIALKKNSDAIRIFRTGIRRNPWTSRVLFDRVGQAKAIIERRIKGQSHAIERTLDILARSVIGLSGAQSGPRHSRPRGVLFLSGPTGVGKTELAKAVTELLFADETACHRFDMSEFMSEDSVSRLIGAPPGQPGHSRGGELVNAAHQRPFSVFLFDEVEKAHPRILDMFLQVLDEGRLTDSRGSTAHFSEALIIFTSNIGMVTGSRASNLGMNVLPSDSHDILERKINAAVQDHFRTELKRPELMNRIGQNVVVFDFLSAEAATLIFNAMLKRVVDTVASEHGIVVEITDAARSELEGLCARDFFEGGRGIGNRIESHFINPLSRELFDSGVISDVKITGVTTKEKKAKLIIERVEPG